MFQKRAASKHQKQQRIKRRVLDHVTEWDKANLTENSDDEYDLTNVAPIDAARRKDHMSSVQPAVSKFAVNPFLTEADIANLRSTSISIGRRQPQAEDEVKHCVQETEHGVRCLPLPFIEHISRSNDCKDSFCNQYGKTRMFWTTFFKLMSHGLDVEYSNNDHRTTIAQLPFRALHCSSKREPPLHDDSSDVLQVFGIGNLITMSKTGAQTVISRNKEMLAKFVKSKLETDEESYFTCIFHAMTYEECTPKSEFVRLPLVSDPTVHTNQYYPSFTSWFSQTNYRLKSDDSCELLFDPLTKRPYVVLTFVYPNEYYDPEGYDYFDYND